MKRLLSCMLLCVSVQFLSSCISTPAAAPDILPVSAESAAPDDGDVVEAVDSTASGFGSAEVIDAEAGEGAVSSSIVSSPPEEQAVPSKPDEPPSSPDPQKLLYFYPEPEAVVVTPPPIEPPAVSVLPPPEASVPAASAAPRLADSSAGKTDADLIPKATKENKVASEAIDAKAETPVPEIRPVEPESPSLKPSSQKTAPSPSRTVALSSGQTLEVLYPGTGWVFLGDSSSRNGLSYLQRKLEGKDTLFSFRARNPGDYVLEFSRFDLLTDAYVPDALSVTVLEASSQKSGSVRAPSWQVLPESAEQLRKTEPPSRISDEPSLRTFSPLQPSAQASAAPASKSSATQPPAAGSSSSSGVSSLPSSSSLSAASVMSAAELLELARSHLAAGKPGDALAALDSFFMNATESLDEGWFLRGQSFEAASPNRDIRKALQAYETLTKAYPASSRWKEADARIRYLRQFYLQIR